MRHQRCNQEPQIAEVQTLQWSKEKGQNMIYQTLHKKLKIEQHERHKQIPSMCFGRFVCFFACLMVFNATFNTISVISWRLVFLVAQVTDKLYHLMLYTSPWSRFEVTTSVVINTDSIGSCKSNYHTITATTTPSEWTNGFYIVYVSNKLALYF